MKKIVKKIAVLISLGIFSAWPGFSNPAQKMQEITLENGLTAFLLENPGDAAVHVTFVCKAGFAAQTQETNGFFRLFTRIALASNPALKFSEASCNTDFSRYSLTITPSQTEKTLRMMADAFFNPAFSDETLSAELSALKSQVKENAGAISYHINAAIDSRVFPDAPWQHDSGIHPEVLAGISQEKARTILTQITGQFYIPQNCAVFISGNINAASVTSMLKESFGRFYAAATPSPKRIARQNPQKKFVFHAEEISADLTQIVVQYTTLSAAQCALLAEILNDDNSRFKKTLVENARLNIPGNEYINVEAVNEGGISRLIIQTLLQKPEGKTHRLTSQQQTSDFLAQVQKIPEIVDNDDFLGAVRRLHQKKNDRIAITQDFLADFSADWARGTQTTTDSLPDLAECLCALSDENPFVFVIINSADFKATKNQYAAGNFEEINKKNSAWYTQEIFKESQHQSSGGKIPDSGAATQITADNTFASANAAQIKTSELSNGITVIKKPGALSTRTTILLSIDGGKIISAENPGFEEMMIQLLFAMIQRELAEKTGRGAISFLPKMDCRTDYRTSSIIIESESDDIAEVCGGIISAIVYGQIPPAMADRTVANARHRKRLENGSAVNQIFYAGVREILKGSEIARIFDTTADILLQVDFSAILVSYLDFLDARRYNIILTGKIPSDADGILEATFGRLEKKAGEIRRASAQADFPDGKSVVTEITHTFLTDIPAQAAGPMPAELVPTKEFLDPVAYIFEMPQDSAHRTEDAVEKIRRNAVYCAVLNFLEEFLQKKCAETPGISQAQVSVILPRAATGFGTVIFQNVRHTKLADSALQAGISALRTLLESPETAEKIAEEIKIRWTLTQMAQTSTDAGTARLLQKSFEMNVDSKPIPQRYLLEHDFIQNAGANDFLDALEQFDGQPSLSVYSRDSQK